MKEKQESSVAGRPTRKKCLDVSVAETTFIETRLWNMRNNHFLPLHSLKDKSNR